MALLEVGTGTPYATIQAAINVAPSGSSIRVNAGGVANVYNESISISGKRLFIFSDLVDLSLGPVIEIRAVAGAAPAVNVAAVANSGLDLENFKVSAALAASADVIHGRVGYDWFRRLVVNGGGTKICMTAQYLENCILYNGTTGLTPSCPGQVIGRHLTCVNMSVAGLVGNVGNGDFKACLTYNCNNAGFVNANNELCCWNFSSDLSAPGLFPIRGIALADIAFVNLGAGNLFLQPGSLAYVAGASVLATDILGKRRVRDGGYRDLRIYGGAHDPYPPAPAYLTGASQIRPF
jgi:hypothetical protein